MKRTGSKTALFSAVLRTGARLCALVLLLSLLPLTGCGREKDGGVTLNGEEWTAGFGSAPIALPETPVCIAGYHNGVEATGLLDLQQARALWLGTGDGGVLLIGIDCVGLSSADIDDIRSSLGGLCRETGCRSVTVFSTHDHAGADTLGLWGEIAMNGKNGEFMENLKQAAVTAAVAAADSRVPGELYYAQTVTGEMQRDSRDPQVWDPALHCFRFVPRDTSVPGIRMVIYSAHAESLRGDNTLISRDYPGVMEDVIEAETGERTLFLPGAVGGLIMTSVQTEGEFDAAENMRLTGERLARYVLDAPAGEKLSPRLRLTRQALELPLDNTLFMYYRFLGILKNPMIRGESETGYHLQSSLTVLSLGERTLAMLPGEIFPELVSGEGLGEGDPEPLEAIARSYGIDGLIVTGLCDDEIGYIVPPSDYLVHPTLPYFSEAEGPDGRKHYEETNSLGKDTARGIADGLREALERHTAP